MKKLLNKVIVTVLMLINIAPIGSVYAEAIQDGDTIITTEIPHTKQDGGINSFNFSDVGWSTMGSSQEHVWSDNIPKDDPSAVFYEVEFIGNKIDIYAGKNHPMGKVKYYIDGEEMGTYSLYNPTNINSTFITSFDNLTEGRHTFRAEATGIKDTRSTNTLIDAAKVVVHHEPYEVEAINLVEDRINLLENSHHQIKYEIIPSYATVEDMTFQSLDENVATVSDSGEITAVGVGSTKIVLSTKKHNLSKEITIDVEATIPDITGSVVDIDTQYTQDRYEEVLNLGKTSQNLTSWKNDKATSAIALASVESALKNVDVSASDFIDGENTLLSENITTTFIKSTKAYNGPYLGYGSTTRPVPEDNGSNRSESSDILYQTEPIDIEFNQVQPVWVEFDIPANTEPGTYNGVLSVTADNIEEALEFNYSIIVQDALLPDATDFKDSFDLEMWQYPYSTAEYYGVEPFSDEHFAYQKPIMEKYKEIGGHAITTSIIEDAWAGQTYSENDVHYPSMVRWTQVGEGFDFEYDYTDFDKWVEFNKELGIGDKIVVYSIAPWHNSFTYYDQEGKLHRSRFNINNANDQKVWKHFLEDLVDHLMEKGWFEDAYIGIDERGFSSAAFDVIESVTNENGDHLKTAGAMDAGNPDLAMRVTDLTMGDVAVAEDQKAYYELLERRNQKGLKTTLYSATEHQPGQFSLSAPVENYWIILHSGKMDTAGFLRWGLDAWVEDPLNDVTHNAFEPGDPFFVFPGDKNADQPFVRSSVRLERIAEGVRDVNKIHTILKDMPELENQVDRLYENLETLPTKGRSYLSDERIEQLISETEAFKAGLNKLTDQYIGLLEDGTNEIESITIKEGKETTVDLGKTKRLTVEFAPENIINQLVTWESSNSKVVEVTDNGLITGVNVGSSTLTVTSVADPSKKASILVKVNMTEIDSEKQVAYYKFDEIKDGKILDSWGSRDGTNYGGRIVEGKSGSGLELASKADKVELTGESGLKDAWSVGYWVKNTNTNPERISVLSSQNGKYSFDIQISNQLLRPGVHVGTGPGDFLSYPTEIPSNEWIHMAWTQNKENGLSLYVNGHLIQRNLWTTTNNFPSPVDVIGGFGFTGVIDELKIYNESLNSNEVASMMQTQGLNLKDIKKDLYIGDVYQIESNLISDEEDKTLTYSSSHPKVATVDAQGVVTAIGRGVAEITVANVASGYEGTVTINVEKKLEIGYTIPQYDLDAKHLSVIEKDPDNLKGRRYLGHPDMVQLEDGTLITSYLEGHGKGPLVLQISKDRGETWVENTNTPASWTGSQETPTLYVLNLEDGTERVILISGLPGWGTDNDGNTAGWNTSYSDDGGETWTEFEHWYPNLPNGNANNTIVAMSSLVQLKDENGDDIQKWMGVYHNYGFENYKTYLTFDEDGNEQWSEPEAYLSDYRSIERAYNISEVGMFRSPDGNRIIALARSQSHMHPSTMFYSDDEGETWSEPENMQGSLLGERHKAIYDPISNRLIITFREITLDYNNNGIIEPNDWMAGDWVAWVGTYEDLMEQNEGQYRIRIAEDFTPSPKGGDTGYAGIVAFDDGTIVMNSYGHFDKEFSENWQGSVTEDLSYIKQAKFKLGEIDHANGLINRESLMTAIEEAKNIDTDKYTSESVAKLNKALEHAESVMADDSSAQVQINESLDQLQTAIAGLESDTETALQAATAAVEKAETTKSVEDIAAAQELVTALEDSVEKTALQDRLDAIDIEAPEETEEEAKRVAVLVDRMIYRLPNVRVLTVEDASLVEAVRSAYEDLSDQAKTNVRYLGNLKLREDRLEILNSEKEVADEFAVRELQRRIYRLPSARNITLADAEQVQAIRAEYDQLNGVSKGIFSPQYLKNLELREEKLKLLE